MKKTNLSKITVIILSCALLIAGIVGISASANGTDASADFKMATLNYGADTKIAFALDINGADAGDVQLYIYKNSDLSGDYSVSNFTGSYYNEVYPIYYSAGISAKDIADYIYAVPVLKATGTAIGDACRYSVAQYCYSVLTDSKSSEDLTALGLETHVIQKLDTFTAHTIKAAHGKTHRRILRLGSVDIERVRR